jgi:hypothetical protein
MGLGNIILKQGGLLNTPNKQSTTQTPPGHPYGDFVVRYLKCLGLGPNELNKLPETIRSLGIDGGAINCINELMKSSSWEEAFTKINLEAALLEAVSRHELQQLSGNKQGIDLLPLYSLYNFMAFINAIRMLINNDATRPIGLTTLAKATYLLFDLLMETTKRKFIDPNLEVEIWKVRETLVDVMEELFKGNRMITVHDKPFDGNRQLH